jgi:hypothetical protein
VQLFLNACEQLGFAGIACLRLGDERLPDRVGELLCRRVGAREIEVGFGYAGRSRRTSSPR